MKKNVAGQEVGVQLVVAASGAAYGGSATVSVTGDGGSQATGSVGSGAATSKGNGYYTYAPAQAETNFDHVAFTFIGATALPATVQFYPSFPQTIDAAGIKTQTDKLTFTGGTLVQADVTDWKASAAPAMTGDAYAALTGAQAEPAQGAPAVNASPLTKLAFLFKAWRNKHTQTSTTYSLYADDTTTVDHKTTVADDGTTFTRNEIATGP